MAENTIYRVVGILKYVSSSYTATYTQKEKERKLGSATQAMNIYWSG